MTISYIFEFNKDPNLCKLCTAIFNDDVIIKISDVPNWTFLKSFYRVGSKTHDKFQRFSESHLGVISKNRGGSYRPPGWNMVTNFDKSKNPCTRGYLD